MVTKTANWAVRTGGLSSGLLILAGGCQTPSEPLPTPRNGTQTQSPANAPAASTLPGPSLPEQTRATVAPWPIDPGLTVVTIIVRRAGPLARLGHDHVITSAAESGSVWIGPTPSATAFELRLPVDLFAVDLPEARAQAGAEFAAVVPDDARAGTRSNMLRSEVLNAAAFPAIKLRSVAATGDWGQALVRVAVELRGVTREQEIPVLLEHGATSLVARGTLQLNQTDFGITPFAVGGGAIQVADRLEIAFEIAATQPQTPVTP